jgi:hypothetical protein
MNEQQEERFSTADFAAAAGRGRNERADRPDGSSSQHDQADADRGGATNVAEQDERTPLFPADQSEGFRSRWTTIQSGFVDEPRQAVEQADSLIAEVMNALARSFADERQQLEQQWDRGDDVSTEDLRLGLKRYRSFFDRLLSI